MKELFEPKSLWARPSREDPRKSDKIGISEEKVAIARQIQGYLRGQEYGFSAGLARSMGASRQRLNQIASGSYQPTPAWWSDANYPARAEFLMKAVEPGLWRRYLLGSDAADDIERYLIEQLKPAGYLGREHDPERKLMQQEETGFLFRVMKGMELRKRKALICCFGLWDCADDLGVDAEWVSKKQGRLKGDVTQNEIWDMIASDCDLTRSGAKALVTLALRELRRKLLGESASRMKFKLRKGQPDQVETIMKAVRESSKK